MDISVFENMTDEDFFSDKLTHIYFTSEVNDKSVEEFLNKINKAKMPTYDNKKLVEPKPIIIHISSPGGELIAGLRLLSIFSDTKVPICTIVDNFSASSATLISINSPYRLVTDYSLTLIHQYSGTFKGKREHFLNSIKIDDETAYLELKKMYLNKTKLKKKELLDLLKHDIWLDATFCIKKGLADRILKLNVKYDKRHDIKASELLKHPEYHNIYLNCKTDSKKIDTIFKKEDNKPYIIHPKSIECFDEDKEENDFKSSSGFSLISRIKTLPQSYCIIDIPIILEDLLPMLYCSKIYMHEHAHIVFNFLYFKYKSCLLDDTIKNTNTIFGLIKKILKERTKLPANIINNINKNLLILKPKECLKYGLCHEIIKIK